MGIKVSFSSLRQGLTRVPKVRRTRTPQEDSPSDDGGIAEASGPLGMPSQEPGPARAPTSSIGSIVSSYMAQADAPASQEPEPGPGPEPGPTVDQVPATPPPAASPVTPDLSASPAPVAVMATPPPTDPVEETSSPEQQDEPASGGDDDMMDIFTQDLVENSDLRLLSAGLAEIDVQALSEECRDVAVLLAKYRKR